MNVTTMTEKDWYQHLVGTKIGSDLGELIPCRAEKKYPLFDWDITWKRIRLRGLGSELTSFLFKLTHDILPTQERLSKTSHEISGLCKLCSSDVIEDLSHALIECSANDQIGEQIVSVATRCSTNDWPKIITLQMELDPSTELSVVWFLAVAWHSIWKSRSSSRRPERYRIRAELEAKVSLLRETRFITAEEKIQCFIDLL